VKAFLASTLLKKLIGPDADLFFDSRICLISMVLISMVLISLILISLILISLIKGSRLSLRGHAALCLPQIARGADRGDRWALLSCLL
jgi:hypothetical protein